MKLIKIIIIIFLTLTIEINADTEKEIINNLKKVNQKTPIINPKIAIT